jgi:hypothetical protein
VQALAEALEVKCAAFQEAKNGLDELSSVRRAEKR